MLLCGTFVYCMCYEMRNATFLFPFLGVWCNFFVAVAGVVLSRVVALKNFGRLMYVILVNYKYGKAFLDKLSKNLIGERCNIGVAGTVFFYFEVFEGLAFVLVNFIKKIFRTVQEILSDFLRIKELFIIGRNEIELLPAGQIVFDNIRQLAENSFIRGRVSKA